MLCSAIVSGCGSPVVSIDEGQRDYEPADYAGIFERWSRDVHIIPVDGVENVLTATATHLSYEFRWAYVVREAHDFRLSSTERQALQEQQFGRLGEGHEFFVTAMSGVDRADRLEPEKGPWEIRLVDDQGRQAAPISIEELRKPTAAEIQYFDFDAVHRRACRVIFPLDADDGKPILSSSTRFYSLRFSSPLGQSEATWKTASNVD
ncbi:MAG: hypothetical protein JRF63_09890 [Deltaproteobacteria bacterium]|nr:hypothetical protein [Deltaproteobacteria bacterium]